MKLKLSLLVCLLLWVSTGSTGSTFQAYEIKKNKDDTHTILGKLKYDPKYPLYTSDAERYGFDQVDAALDKVFSAQLPVVFFIHGRGNEPNKSIFSGTFVEGGAVRKLETQYKTKVLMFNWNSKATLSDRTEPLSQMNVGAESLRKVLLQVKDYLNRIENKNKKMVLVAHSMGSIILQTLIQKAYWPTVVDQKPLFSQILISSPDADNVKHWEWLNELSASENIFVTINKDDDILEKSTDDREEGRDPLGLKPVLPLSPKVTYLDLSKLGETEGQASGRHEVFNKEKMDHQIHLCNVLHDIITGESPKLSIAADLTDQSNYFKVKFLISNNDKCFKWTP